MSRATVLIVDDEARVISGLTRDLMLEAPDLLLVPASNVKDALEQFKLTHPTLVLTDIRMAGEDGFSLLRQLQQVSPGTPVVLMSGAADTGMVRQAFLCGAVDFLEKPFVAADFLKTMKRVVKDTPDIPRDAVQFNGLVGNSTAMRDLFTLITRVAPSRATVVVLGESGTGKELVANAIHQRSPRAEKPFVALNCGALTESLLESELFGHEKGAFTGADRAKEGLFEAAHGGTIFLDEIGEVTPAVQLRLLRVLQEGQVQRIGSTSPRSVDVRVIAATHADLPAMVKRGTFREDLYFRLHVIGVPVPALRQRRDDIPLLAAHFLTKYNKQNSKQVAGLTPEAMQALQAHGWPGNVRELENVINRAVVLCEGPLIDLSLLQLERMPGNVPAPQPISATPAPAERRQAHAKLDDQALLAFVAEAKGSLSGAARLAGIDRSNFRRLLKARGLYDQVVHASDKAELEHD